MKGRNERRCRPAGEPLQSPAETYTWTGGALRKQQSTRKRDSAADLAENRRGIQSVEVGIPLLKALQDAAGPLTLTSISDAARMPASKAHRYLASYVRGGLVRQNAETRHYELGPVALTLGLAALSQLDLISLSHAASREVTESTGLTTLLSVWSDRGAVVIRWNRGTQPVITSLSLGSVLPPLASATGQVFLANLPRSATADAVRQEQRARQKLKSPTLSEQQIDEIIGKVRHQGASWIDGGFVPGLRAYACAVLDYQGEAAAAITLVSSVEPLADPKHPAAKVLTEQCARVTEQAGKFTLPGPRHR
jgi:DNA-binding IclR family transcriptional regulator